VVEGWQWDESLFEGAAEHYARGRLPYAPGLAEVVRGLLPRTEHRRLLDVGCGPGTLTLLLAHLFTECVGIDPDPGMIAKARAAGLDNATFIQVRAEQLPADLGSFDVATFGQSFHWMDRDLVAATVYDMLSPGGLFMQVSYVTDALPQDLSNLAVPVPPYEAIHDLIRFYLGPVRRAGKGVIAHGTPDDEVEVVARHGFYGPVRIRIPAGPAVERSAEEIVSWIHSRSDAVPALFGADLADFDADLRALLRSVSAGQRFTVWARDTEVLVWCKAA
jgi:SAM-dependent methyltransferase